MNVDQLQKDTSLEDAARKCGITLNASGSGPEVRIDCPFGCAGDHLGRKEISINTANDEKVFLCHSYQCGFRGNMLALMHGWLTGKKPSGDKLRGAEFQRVRDVLADRIKIEPATSSQSRPVTDRIPVNLHSPHSHASAVAREFFAELERRAEKLRRVRDVSRRDRVQEPVESVA